MDTDKIIIFLTAASAIATIASAWFSYVSCKAKDESKKTLEEIKSYKKSTLSNLKTTKVENSGTNSGVMSAINTGEINNNEAIKK